MDIEKYLILLKDEDKTQDIRRFEYYNGTVIIEFNKNEKQYKYSRNNFKYFDNPEIISIEGLEKTLADGDIFNVKKILKFGSYCKIIFLNNISHIISASKINLCEKSNCISEDRFNYFKEISKIVSVKTEDGTALLTKEYEKVNFVEKDTALYQYLNPQNNCINLSTDKKEDMLLIFPFGSNKSQYKAVENAMMNQISVIEGPPGTGKTQTILNIIANIVSGGKTVAVVSNNNAATANVYEKLQDNGLGAICAVLGRKENKDDFIANQSGICPQFGEELINKAKFSNKILELNKKLNKIFDLQNKKAIDKGLLNEIKMEHEYYRKYETLDENFKIRSFISLNPRQIMKLKVQLEDSEINNKKLDLGFKLKAVILFGIGNFKFYKLPISKIIENYNEIYFLLKEYNLSQEINSIVQKLKFLNDKDTLEQLKTLSQAYLKSNLSSKYKEKGYYRTIFNSSDLYIQPEKFMREYPVVFSTTYSIKECLKSEFKYDYIIMDEASQVDLITGTLALSCAKNAIIVGDRKQLPNVVSTDNRKKVEEISVKYKIANNYNFLNECFLTSVLNSIPNIPKVLLKEHYRCHPKIIEFSNKKFYDNELIILTEENNEKDIMKVFITSEGNHTRDHYNQRQIEIIRDEILPELKNKIDNSQIGIVSPYNDQKNELINLIVNEEIKVDTVHKFQGREKDAIVITTVDNEISSFVDDPKLLNVAVTRAKKYLRLVVSKEICNGNSNLNDLIRYIQYNNFEVVESKIKSIYDLLYKANREQRLQYLKNKKRISDFDSENITYNVIKEIINKNDFNNLDVTSHVPLMNLLNDVELLLDEEKKYATNEWTHIDFVVYNKMDKKMIMAVEVDGYYFHKKGTRQSGRDELKNSILQKYNIPLVRLSTVGSGEENILENKMKKVFEDRNRNNILENNANIIA